MFEHSSSGAQALPPDIWTDDLSGNLRNTSYMTPQSLIPEGLLHASPQAKVNMLVCHFSLPSISSYKTAAPPQPPLTHTEMIPSSPQPSTACSPSFRPFRNQTVSSLRLQRSLNRQLQQCTAHIRSIESLVENMILSNSQCVLHPSPPLSSSTPQTTSRPSNPHPLPIVADNLNELIVDDAPKSIPTPQELSHEMDLTPLHEDEGFAEMDDIYTVEEGLALHRMDTSNAVSKMLPVYKRSKDCAMAMHEQGKVLVRNRPRMRRRRPRRAGE